MNKQKLATIGCIILSVVFALSLGLFIHFKLFLPFVSNIYEKTLYYPEALYEEYQKETERMIAEQDYTSKYRAEATFYSENGRTTLVIKIGDYDKGYVSDYITATVENFGTNEQEVTFKRSRESAEEAYEDAERYRTSMSIYTAVFVSILLIFTTYLIINSLKKRYQKVLKPILLIGGIIFGISFTVHFLLM